MSVAKTPARLLPSIRVAVVGAGPAGLMAASVLRERGAWVEVFDAMPSAGRKFLLAGIGGLNLTHSEDASAFAGRYAERRGWVEPWLRAFGPAEIRDWALRLGIETFIGSSGRVFPKDLKAAPLLRAWLQELRRAESGRPAVRFHMRRRWEGWDARGQPRFASVEAAPTDTAPDPPAFDATLLALGGASWPRLGSDGAWAALLARRGVAVAPFKPANCGFDVAPTGPGRAGWSDHLRERWAGAPVKPVVLSWTDPQGRPRTRQGEFVLTRTGVEGSLIYAAAADLRDRLLVGGPARITLDLLPQHAPGQVLAETLRPRGARSLATHLKSRLGLHGAKTALLHEVLAPARLADPHALAHALKALPIELAAPRPLDEAISTAGGVMPESLDERLMLRAAPGVFCAGEMLDWEAPTGGYLLTACLASGHAAGQGVWDWCAGRTGRE